MRLSLDSIEVLHSEPQQYLQQVSHPVCSDTMLMQMWLSWKLEGLIVVFFYLVDHVMITRTHTHQSQTHTYTNLLVSFLRTFSPKGFLTSSRVLLRASDGCWLGMLTCSWGTSNLCLLESVIWWDHKPRGHRGQNRVCVSVCALVCVCVHFYTLNRSLLFDCISACKDSSSMSAPNREGAGFLVRRASSPPMKKEKEKVGQKNCKEKRFI